MHNSFWYCCAIHVQSEFSLSFGGSVSFLCISFYREELVAKIKTSLSDIIGQWTYLEQTNELRAAWDKEWTFDSFAVGWETVHDAWT